MSFLDDWKEWSTAKKSISLIIVCCVGLIIIGLIGGFGSDDVNTNSGLTVNVTDLAVTDQGFGKYELTGTLTAENCDHLEAQVVFYGPKGEMLWREDSVWSMDDVPSNQPIEITGNVAISGGNQYDLNTGKLVSGLEPTKAKVLFYDSTFTSDETDAIYTQTIDL